MFSPFSPIPQPQSPMQAFGQGVATSQNIFNSIMRNKQIAADTQAQLYRNPYIAPMAQADLLKQQQENQIYLPTAEANLRNLQLQNQMYVPKTQAEIDYQLAQAGDASAEARLRNQTYNNPALGRPGIVGDIAAANMNGLIPNTVTPNPTAQPNTATSSPVSNMTLMNPTPNLLQQFQSSVVPNSAVQPNPLQQFQNRVAPNLLSRGLNAEVAEQEAKANWYNRGGSGMGVDQKALTGLQQQIAMENPNFTPEQINQAASAYLAGGNSLPDGTQLAPPSGNVRYFLDSMDKHVNTASGLKQQNADAILDGLLGKGDQLMPNVSQFAGLAGKGMQTASQIAASLGANDPKYTDYLNFTRQIVPQVANQMLLTEGARVNNTQKAMMLRVADPTYWDSNPKQALAQWNYLTDTMKNLVKPIVRQGPSGIRETLNSPTGQTPGQSSDTGQLTAPQQIDYKRVDGKLVRVSS